MGYRKAVEDIGERVKFLSLSRSSPPISNRSEGARKSDHKIPQRTCSLCKSLWPNEVVASVHTEVIYSRLVASSRRTGCTVCGLLAQGISEFGASLTDENKDFLSFRNLDQKRIEILPSRSHQKILSARVIPAMASDLPSIVLDFFTTDEPPAWPHVQRASILPARLDLEYAIATARTWIRHCNSNHSICKVHSKPSLPTRVLDLGLSHEYNNIRLVSLHGATASYVTLSYCWGSPGNMIKTTKDSLSMWTERIPWSQLPITFKDAVRLTKALGVRYLGIDALCILQDDKKDWERERESAMMAKIYSDSYITIAATSTSDPHTSLFSDRWTRGVVYASDARADASLANSRDSVGNQPSHKVSIEALEVPNTDMEGRIFVRPHLHLAHNRFTQVDNAMEHSEDAPLLSRAWAFQERLLPARTIHFHAEELIWECKSGVSCECKELEKEQVIPAVAKALETTGWLKRSLATASEGRVSTKPMGYVWMDIVSEYSRLQLTHESDRMAALSGIASSLSGKALGSYVAGIWQRDLGRGILFERVNPAQTNERVESPQSFAPSWSWASLPLYGSNAVSYDRVLRYGFTYSLEFKVISAEFSIIGENPFGWVINGILKLKGSCVSAELQPSPPFPAELQPSPPFPANTLEARVGCRFSRATFVNDDRTQLHDRAVLLCFLIGLSTVSQRSTLLEYALVLRKSGERPNSYHRVGVLSVDRSKGWFQTASVETVDII